MSISVTNKAITGGDVHTVAVGRYPYLNSGKSARPATARATTSRQHYARKGRAAYVNDVLGGRKVVTMPTPEE